MPRIKQLSQEDILKIAAGEVVSKPANVLKELIENALDAHAKTITVQIWQGGKKLIVVQDDGLGMDEEDAIASVLPHATSKISSVTDLENLSTFGFRGEALASIAAVSRLEIKTCQDNGSGLSLTWEQGRLLEKKAVGMAQGTIVSVKDVFFNLPVRKKFLKSDETEANQLWQVFLTQALANKNINFKFFQDNRQVCNAVATNELTERVAQLFDFNLANSLLPFEGTDPILAINGLTSNLQLHRYNRQNIYLFINGRVFKDSRIANAICAGYQGALPAQKFPVTFLFLTIPADLIDVNIHPSKEEVSIVPYDKVLKQTKEAISCALEQTISTLNGTNISEQITPENNSFFPNRAEEQNLSYELEGSKTPFNDKARSMWYNSFSTSLPNSFNFDEQRNLNSHLSSPKIPPSETIRNANEIEKQVFAEQFFISNEVLAQRPRIIGQIFKTYVLFEQDNRFCLMDQHAASERILYEEMKISFSNLPVCKLVVPHQIKLPKQSISKIINYVDVFHSFGFLLANENDTLVISGTPPKLNLQDLSETFEEIAALETDGLSAAEIRKKLFESVHAQLACKTAIKAGMELSLISMEQLLSKLFEVENKFQCIHGRPTIYEFNKTEIEKFFRRPSN